MLVEGERGMFSKSTQLGAPKVMFYYDFVVLQYCRYSKFTITLKYLLNYYLQYNKLKIIKCYTNTGNRIIVSLYFYSLVNL